MTTRKRKFQCELAHGSGVAFVTGFANIKELYQKIADAHGIQVDEILFCTLNTHEIDMDHLIGEKISVDDRIFAHLKNFVKEIKVVKRDGTVGITITDNGNGYVFIRAIKEGSIIDDIPEIKVGDHIEKINDESMLNKTHYEVGKHLKDLPKGALITFRLVEPKRSRFIAKKSLLNARGIQSEYSNHLDDSVGISRVNEVLKSYLGLKDIELARQIWELAVGKENTEEFLDAIEKSSLVELEFSEELIFELWGVYTDVCDGRTQTNSNVCRVRFTQVQ